MNAPDMPLSARLAALWDHLGLGAAHVATQVPGDVAGFAAVYPERIAGLTFCVPTRLDPAPFAALAGRVLMIAGDAGLTETLTARVAAALPGSRRVTLADYNAPGWADVVADRGEAVVAALRGQQARHPAAPPAAPPPHAGEHAGITYTARGRGPALVLLPFFLAPSQWEPGLSDLARDFTVIVLGGRHLGGVAALEDRAQAPHYRALFANLTDALAPRPGEAILDVGCGSGALDRLLAARLGGANAITATDINPFLLREAAALARAEGCAGIEFREANAETLPFADASFDVVFSVTVLEECDADRALREMHRVLRPGGRAGVVVRAIDLPQWWHMDLPPALAAKANVPPQSVGPRGVADASLYARMAAAGFRDLACFPSLVTLQRTEGPIWRYREDHVLALLDADERAAWEAARESARRAGLLMMAHPLHAAVGVKPREQAA
jgi:ubiquinone/menaquinone biosynthesis C-methylase UbiE